MKKQSLLLLFLIIALFPQEASSKQKTVYKGGEKLVYEVYYSIGFLYFNVARAVMQVDPVEFNGTKAYRLMIYANTHRGYGENTLNDTLTAYVERETLKPLYMKQATHENKYNAWNIYRYNYTDTSHNCQIERIRSNGNSTMEVSDKRQFYDVLNFVYQLRNTIDPDQLAMNQKVGNLLVLDDGIYSLYWRYAGPERIKIRNKNIYDCLKIKPAFVDSQLFEEGEMMTLYISDDKNKVPIMVEAKLKLGAIKAYLVDYKNLSYPLKSLVKEANK